MPNDDNQKEQKMAKLVIGAGLALFFLTLLFAPWTWEISTHSGGEFSPIWNQPSNSKLNVTVLVAEWIGIGILTFGVRKLL
jgi:hypothetical protein